MSPVCEGDDAGWLTFAASYLGVDTLDGQDTCLGFLLYLAL